MYSFVIGACWYRMDLESFRKRFPLEDGEKVVGVVFWPLSVGSLPVASGPVGRGWEGHWEGKF